jgi:FkbM family methyltransferase
MSPARNYKGMPMSARSRIRHSFIGKIARTAIHAIFRIRHPGRNPIEYELPSGIQLRLYPEGEIAEFLSFPWLFERAELALAAAFLKPGMTVIDVGANIGLYSILAAKRVGPSGSIWAFEPAEDSAARLERNLILNNCHHAHVCRLALSDTDTSLPLVSDHGFGDAYRYLTSQVIPKRGHDCSIVKVTTLDAWATANGITQPDFLKVDIEGGEYRMFLGAREILSSAPKVVIMFECESDWCARAGCRPRDVFDLLSALGFGLYAWDNRSRRWHDDVRSQRSSTFWAARNPSNLPDPQAN